MEGGALWCRLLLGHFLWGGLVSEIFVVFPARRLEYRLVNLKAEIYLDKLQVNDNCQIDYVGHLNESYSTIIKPATPTEVMNSKLKMKL